MRKFLIAIVLIAVLSVPAAAFAACPAGQVAVGTNPDGTETCQTAQSSSSGGSSGTAGDGSSSSSSSGGGSSTVLLNPIGGTATNPSGVSSVPLLLGNVLRALFGVLGSIALLMFIYGGFVWLTSGGTPDNIKKGKDTMVWAVLGLAVIFTSYALVAFVIDRLTAV